MKVGSLIKCKGEETQHTKKADQFGVIVKLEQSDMEHGATWAFIQWHDGHRTWEEMELSLEHNFEVIA